MPQQVSPLSLNKPFMKFGKTIIQLQDTSHKKRNDKHTDESILKLRLLQSERRDNLNLELDNADPNSVGAPWQATQLQDSKSKKRSNEYVPEPGVKVRRLQGERHDNLNLELDNDDSNTVCTPLWSLPIEDGGGDGGGGGGGSTQATQQVSQLGLPTENLPACSVAPSDKMYIAGNAGTVSSSQQQFGISGIVSKASTIGQLVGSVPPSRETQFVGTMQSVFDVGTKIVSSSSASGLVMTSSELGGSSSQYIKYLPSIDCALPVVAQQPMQNTLRQPNVYIPDSVYSALSGKQGSLTAGGLSCVIAPENLTTYFSQQQQMFEEKLQQSRQLCSQKDAPWHQLSQQGQAKQHQPYISLKNQEPTVPSFAGITREKSNEKHKKLGFRALLPVDNTGRGVSSNAIITTPSCVVLPQQQKLVSVNASSQLKGKISAKPASLSQLPAVEASQITALPPVMHTDSQHTYISNPIQNNTAIVSNQQTEDFEDQHLYSRYDAKH
jgi:hypothetical protein